MGIFLLCCFKFMLIILILIPSNCIRQSSAADNKYEICRRPFQCEFIKDLSYPFYDGQNRPAYCGYPGFQINCSKPMPQILVDTSSEKYYLLSVSLKTHTMSVARADYLNTLCPLTLSNNTINSSLYNYDEDRDLYITLYYRCEQRSSEPSMNQFSCSNTSSNSSIGYLMTNFLAPSLAIIPDQTCKTKIVVPAYQSAVVSIADVAGLKAALRNGFGLQWAAENKLCSECRASGGECGYNRSRRRFICYCSRYQPFAFKCKGYNRSRKPTIAEFIILGACLSTLAALMVIILVVYLKRRCQKDNQDIKTFLKTYGSFGPKRYAYADLKKITHSFRDKLGEGGYGTVYRGKLQDGNLVAVKLLKKPEGNAEEFINEVASIGSTNHVNIVTLLGFCFEGQKRALIYDYMPSGSLEKFIYGRTNHQSLGWETLFQIAIGIARGLEYLHQGCNTRILHFDIKPHNILLDENFCPKISDFGLAKLCQHKDSLVPMSTARGTAGYIAPEVFFKSFGGVSYKSDVYSYGMLVLEMVGCRRDADTERGNSDDAYFPNCTYKQLDQGEDIDGQSRLNKEEREIQKKMITVSLWCVQTNPSSRPTITRVIEMLEGKLESLSYPPMQSLEYPEWPQPSSSSTATKSSLEGHSGRTQG